MLLLDAPGGKGSKTFLINLLLMKVRYCCNIAVTNCTFRFAAIPLEEGRMVAFLYLNLS